MRGGRVGAEGVVEVVALAVVVVVSGFEERGVEEGKEGVGVAFEGSEVDGGILDAVVSSEIEGGGVGGIVSNVEGGRACEEPRVGRADEKRIRVNVVSSIETKGRYPAIAAAGVGDKAMAKGRP